MRKGTDAISGEAGDTPIQDSVPAQTPKPNRLGNVSSSPTYELIYADPPWKQARGGKKSVRPHSSGKELPYQVESLEEIEELIRPFVEATPENSIMFMWTIDKYLHEAEQMASRLGYKLHARMIWNKVTGIPAAFTIRYGHEYLLYLYKGKLLPVAKAERGKIHSVFTEQVTQHSRKPKIAYEIIERLYPDLTKLELFARTRRYGWDVWGNQAPQEYEPLQEGSKL